MSKTNDDNWVKISLNHSEFKKLKVDEINTIEEEKNPIVSQLSQDIHNSNPSPYLLSGYRGAGKTTLMRKVEAELESRISLKEKRILFVYVSIPKYQDINHILRKISRSIYKAMSDYELKHEEFKFDKEVKDKIELLYIKTFYQVTDSYRTFEKSNKQYSFSSDFNIQKFLTLVSPSILLLFYSLFNITKFNFPTYITLLLVVFSITWLSFALKINYKFTKDNQNEKEELIKKLYDNEIAEEELLEALSEICKEINMVLILDEIDKIEKDEDVDILINELKPLMLSEYIYTVLVTGQNLYYQYYLANSKDNAVISSLFSKVVHVPILNVTKFEKLLRDVFSGVESNHENLLRNYIKSKIFESNRIPRRLFNLMHQDIIWEENQAKIRINLNQKEYLKWNSEVFDIITSIEEQILDQGYTDGIKDFILNQLHNWVKKIISLDSGFTKMIILSTSIEEKHPLKDFNALEEFLDSLINKLLDSKKIILESTDTDEEIYRLNYTKELIKGMKGKSNSYEIEKMYYLREMIEKIYLNTNKAENINIDEDNKTTEEKLYDLNIFDTSLVSNNISFKSSDLVRDILNVLKFDEKNITKANLNKVNILKYNLLEEYVYYLIRKYLDKEFLVKQEGTKRSNIMFDIMASDENHTFLFEIKLIKNKSAAKSTLINEILRFEKFMEKNLFSNNEINLGILIFIEEAIFEKDEKQILSFVNNQLEQYKEFINVKIISDFNYIQVKELLDEMNNKRKVILE